MKKPVSKHPIIQAAEAALVDQQAAQATVTKIMMIATILAYYLKDGDQKQRHINVLIDSPTGNITKSDLQALNQSAITRLVAENGIQATEVMDLVVTNISTLGMMTDEEFYGKVEG
jgi:hypothetical protein